MTCTCITNCKERGCNQRITPQCSAFCSNVISSQARATVHEVAFCHAQCTNVHTYMYVQVLYVYAYYSLVNAIL